jgi:hypothetical protein
MTGMEIGGTSEGAKPVFEAKQQHLRGELISARKIVSSLSNERSRITGFTPSLRDGRFNPDHFEWMMPG